MLYISVMPAFEVSWFRFKPSISCARVTHTSAQSFHFFLCGLLGYEFQQYSLTFKWELRLISSACPKIEISQDRRTITASCFPAVPCQHGCRVSVLFTQFLFKCSAPQSSHVHLQHFTAFITSALSKADTNALQITEQSYESKSKYASNFQRRWKIT